MSKYNPKIHNRRSIRLKGYDYSKPGLYFVTICCQNRRHLYGKIKDGKMILNEAGQMVEKWYFELENKFKNIRCLEMVVMQNHVHCIIQIIEINTVGIDLRVYPNIKRSISKPPSTDKTNTSSTILSEHKSSPLSQVIQWFKTMSTNEYIRGVKNKGWQRFDRRLWERNYYEYIIRNESAYQRIAAYIIANPEKWTKDRLRK